MPIMLIVDKLKNDVRSTQKTGAGLEFSYVMCAQTTNRQHKTLRTGLQNPFGGKIEDLALKFQDYIQII